MEVENLEHEIRQIAYSEKHKIYDKTFIKVQWITESEVYGE